jgi:hypothetical protein
MGIDWWSENSYLNPNKIARKLGDDDLESRLERIEKRLLTESSSPAIPELIEPVHVEIDG